MRAIDEESACSNDIPDTGSRKAIAMLAKAWGLER